MKIAMTYENGNIYQHFGRTQQFKIYDLNENRIIDSHIIDSNGAGHGALAEVLFKNNVDMLICGGIGQGAVMALHQWGIKVYGGASGSCDEIMNQLLNGTLQLNTHANCNHHHHEHGECHCGDHHDDHHQCHCHDE